MATEHSGGSNGYWNFSLMVRGAPVVRALRKLGEDVGSHKDTLKVFAGHIGRDVRKNIRGQHGPTGMNPPRRYDRNLGGPWPRLRPETLRTKKNRAAMVESGKILRYFGSASRSIMGVTNKQLTYGSTSFAYAHVHNFGAYGQLGSGKRGKAKKGFQWAPSRTFLGWSKTLQETLPRLMSDHYQEMISRAVRHMREAA